MDSQLAIVEVQQFVVDVRRLQVLMGQTPYSQDHPNAPGVRTSLSSRMALVEGIAKAVNLTDLDRLRNWDGYPGLAINAGEELLGILGNAEQWERVLGASGPKLAAAEMHPWVWSEAASRWDAHFYRDAVQAAATRIFDVELPAKLGVQPSKDPASLFAAFAPDKNSGTVLRFPGVDPASASWASLHRGTMLFGQGCVMAIRNPRTHRLDVSEDQAALEELAALSLLARWIDDTVVETLP